MPANGTPYGGNMLKFLHLSHYFTFHSIWRRLLGSRAPSLIYMVILESLPLSGEMREFGLFFFESKKCSDQFESDIHEVIF